MVPVGDGEIGALVAMGVVGGAVPCNSKGSTLAKNKRDTTGAQVYNSPEHMQSSQRLLNY